VCAREIRVSDLKAAKTQDFAVVKTHLESELSAHFEERNFRQVIELVDMALNAEGEVVGLLEETDGLAQPVATDEDFSAALDEGISVYLNRLMLLGSMLGFPLFLLLLVPFSNW